MLIEIHKILFFSLVNMEIEAFEQSLSLQKHGDVVFVKTPVIGAVANNFIKRRNIPTKHFDYILRQ